LWYFSLSGLKTLLRRKIVLRVTGTYETVRIPKYVVYAVGAVSKGILVAVQSAAVSATSEMRLVDENPCPMIFMELGNPNTTWNV
jgi:hypothetical protein